MRRSRPYWLALCLCVHSASAQAGNLLPNLYVGLECKDIDPNRIEADFERFFADNNFRFTNRSRFVRENGGRTPFSTQIIALKQNQMMGLEKAGYYNNKYIITVTARSPEDNDMFFYEKVGLFSAERSYCDVVERRFSSFPNKSSYYFDWFYEFYLKWFDQAAQRNQKSSN